MPGKPHPRIAGTFARALRAPVGADPWAGIAERVHRMTGMPAQRYRIPGGRGVLQAGAVADLVVFDPATVTDRSTYPDPLLAPAGHRPRACRRCALRVRAAGHRAVRGTAAR